MAIAGPILSLEAASPSMRQLGMAKANCSECRRYLAEYKNAVALGKKTFAHSDEQVPDEVPEDLIKAIVAATGKPDP